jgi:uncharacterized protein (TIGR04255 family)
VVDYPTLKNAPISEAVIEIRLGKPLSNFDEISPGLLEEFAELYPQKKEIRSMQFSFKAGDPNVTAPSEDLLGYRLESQDGKYILQFKKDGIALSNVGPYDRWSTFVAKFNETWTMFSEKFTELKICRIAVRYINRFTLSKEHEDYYKKWTTLNINNGANLKKTSLAYLIEQKEFKTIVKIDTSENNNNKYEISLDIDAFCEKEFSNSEINSALTKLRQMKNEIFFNNINPEIIKEFS